MGRPDGSESTESERPVYFAQDTHWTPFGAAIAIRRLVESIDPSVWTADELRVDGEAAYPMDLSRLMGLPRTESMDSSGSGRTSPPQ